MLRTESLGGADMMKAHLRNSLAPKPLKHHLSREALPQIRNYNTPGNVNSSRPTMEELYLGETPKNKEVN